MKSRTERSMARGQKIMEGVNMPASLNSAWRWLIGATFAAIVGLGALPGVGHAENIEICITPRGRIKGINLGIDQCNPPQVELDWVSIGPAGAAGPTGPTGVFGPQGPQGAMGAIGPTGPTGVQGVEGPQGDQGVSGATGPTGPTGMMGQFGMRGQTGVAGATGAPGVNGVAEPNITFFTGGSLGTLGFNQGTDLSGLNANPDVLILGPGNGSDSVASILPSTTPQNVQVPMADNGTAERLFVNTDNDPGSTGLMPSGPPNAYFFFLCDNYAGSVSGCGLTCTMVGPDTACNFNKKKGTSIIREKN